jgi:hypothetical protein
MKPLISACLFAILLVIASCNDTATTDTPAEKTDTPSTAANTTPAPPPQVDSATSQKNMMDYMTPGDVHAMLAKSNGTWNVETSMFMAPGAPPETSKGKAVNKMILGGRYQVTEFKGTMMGQPFEGISTLGYDKHKNVFENTWVDNMGTGITKMTGPWDEATKSITFTGKMMDPMTKYEMDVKQVFKIVDDNTQQLEMFTIAPDKSEVKFMEIKYTRAK